MSCEEFRDNILKQMENRPKWSRKGQFVFNYIEETYGSVARKVQFIDHIDCFYDDDMIDPFIIKCWENLRDDLS